MAVSQSRYVKITSGVGAAETVAQRQFIGRLFTDNALLPPQSYMEFSSADDVGAYFGTSSAEYLRAQFYFSWVSKNITQPQTLSFSRWVDSAVPGYIYGAQSAYVLSTFTPVSTGSLNLTIGATTHQLTGITLTGDASLAAVAATIQVAIRAYSAGGADWTAATVAYVASPSHGGQPQFVLTGGVTGVEAIGIEAATSGTDLGPLLGLLSATAIIASGSAVETITETLTTAASLSNNFGSFAFIPSLTTQNIIDAATWNDGQNVLYMFMVSVTASTAVTIIDAIADFAGSAVTLSPISDEYPELIPMTVLAATNYSALNSVQNYMFQTGFPCTPSVTDDADADTYDALGVNYYVQTQNAGQFINFYATGVLTGTASDPVDQNVYANEQWLKDALGAQLMSLLLALANLSADIQGEGQISTVMQAIVQQALPSPTGNGTIAIGKPLDAIQQLYITNATGDSNAWLQVQNVGYWLKVSIKTMVVDDVTKYFATYLLIYSKDDVIREIQGSDVLI